VDGGANIGCFAVYAAALFPDVPIVCYEPEPENAQLLRRTLAASNIQAEVVEKGLWSRAGRLYFHPHESFTGNIKETPSDYPIEVTTVDAPSGCWLKLDIEGAEYEVLPQVLNSGCRPAVISMEIHHANTRGGSLLELLRQSGYEIHGNWGPEDNCGEITAVLKVQPK
jgi:FkbM family methyltransferase